MIRVTTASRLHFGLFRLPAKGGLRMPVRHFGGVGLMIDKPGARLSAAPAEVWSATGPCAERVLAYAQEFLHNCPEIPPHAFALAVERAAPEHVGLGTGTQLALGFAKALAMALGRPDWDSALLARRV